MTGYQPGEIVDITIRGARIEAEYEDGLTVDIAPENPSAMPVDLPWGPDLAVERRAPAEWPPQPGDLWRDRNGDLWFGCRYCADPDDNADWEGCNDDGWRTVLTPSDGGPYGNSSKRPDAVNQQFGPMALVHREDEQDGGDRG